MQIENNLTLLTSILANGETILIPADGVWGLSCDARDRKAIDRITSHLNHYEHYCEEILVLDINMLKSYASELHPRIETLLVYHERPLRIKCEQQLISSREIFMRIVKDQISRILLNEIGFPLYFISFLENDKKTHLPPGKIVTNYNNQNISFIAEVEKCEEIIDEPLLRIAFDKDGLIKILE